MYLGELITAALDLDRSWMVNASCRGWQGKTSSEPTPWQVSPPGSTGGTPNFELRRYALMICFGCQAQYDCARYAIDGKMQGGIWAMPPTSLKMLQRKAETDRDAVFDLIAFAESEGVAMQVISPM
jgi:hypothetical protein